MSNVAKTNNSYRMLTVLLLGLSILNVSAFMTESLSERSLASSEDDEIATVEGIGDCGLRRRLNEKSGNTKDNSLEVNCDGKYETDNKTVEGNVTVRKIKTGTEEGDYEFEVEMNLETECEVCQNNIRSTGVIRPTTKDFGSLERFINKEFKKESVKLLKQVKKDKKKIKDIEQCLADGDGNPFVSDDESSKADKQNDCMIEKISNGDLDDKQVAKLYDSRLKPALNAMMNSGDTAQMQKAMALLGELRSAGTNGYVNSSVQDMMQFGSMRMKAAQLEKQMALMDPKDPRYQMLSQQAAGLSKQADGYFNGRINQVQTQSMFMTDGFEYASSLIADLQTWQSDLATSMNSLVQQAGSSVNGQGSSGGNVPTDISGRTQRGGVAGQNGPNNGNGSGIPQVGAPVNGNGQQQGQNGMQIPRVGQGPQQGPQQNFQQQQQAPWMNQGQQQQAPWMQQQGPQQQQQQPPWMQQQRPPWAQQGPQPMPMYSNQPRPGQYGPGGQFPPLNSPGGGFQSTVPGYNGMMPPGYNGVPYRYM